MSGVNTKSQLNAYIKTTLSNEISQHYFSKHLISYNLMRVKRFLIQTLIVFIFQYLTVINFTFTFPSLPMNPSMGLAFTLFYLLGKSAIPGLFLGGLTAYLLKGFSVASISLYLSADIVLGCIAAYYCNNILSSDIRTFASIQENIKFLKVNALICLGSTFLRTLAIFLNQKKDVSFNSIFFNIIDLYLADLNGILVLSVFLISWVCIPFTREKIIHGPHKRFPAILVTIIIISAVLAMNRSSFYIMMMAIIVSMYLIFIYGTTETKNEGYSKASHPSQDIKKSGQSKKTGSSRHSARHSMRNPTLKKLPLIALLIFVLFSLLFMDAVKLICFILIVMLASLYLAYAYGYLIATALMFILSSIYMASFTSLKIPFVEQFGLALYTVVPMFLFLYIVGIIYLGHSDNRRVLEA